MTDYTKLVKALRCCFPQPQETCDGCQYNTAGECNVGRMMLDAAAAIEELQAKVADYEDTLKWHQKEFAELRAMIDDANARLEVGKAGNQYTLNEPKRGEWIFKGTGGSMGIKTCSVCGYRSWQSKLDLGNMGNYCPNCGAKMEV